MQTPSRRNTVASWIVVAAFLVLWLMHGWSLRDQARSHDFLCFYSGAYMTSHGRVADLYDPAVQFAVQRKLVPSTVEVVPFVRPPFYALLLAPLGWLPFRAAFVCWMLLQIGVFVACLTWAWQRFGTPALVFGCMSMPVALGIANGQDGVLFLAILIASYRLAERGMELIGGVVLGLLLVKFHLAPLWPIALILQRRWKMLGGFVATGAVAAGLSLAMIGVDGVRAYAALLRNRDLAYLMPSPELMISFQGLAANFGITSMLANAALVTAILALFLAALWHAPLWRTYAATTAASLLLVPHVYEYDAAMLLLGLWLAMFCSGLQPTRIVALWLCTPLPFTFTLAGKPWAALSSLSLLALVAALAAEALRLNPPASLIAKDLTPHQPF
jgi:hypothetical protein